MSMKVYVSMKVDDLKTKFQNRGKNVKRIDGELPLNLRFGSRIQISEAPFLLTGEQGLLKYPGEESLIGGFSEVDMAGLKTYRLYLKDRDDDSQESMILVIMNDKGDAADELYLFREYEEIPLYYANVDEVSKEGDEIHAVQFWIDESEGIIGMPMFHTPDDYSYERQWNHDADERIAELKFHESINLDPYGELALEVEHLGTMVYARTFDGIGIECDEYLLPTIEKDDDGFRVRIWIGMPLAESDLVLPDAV